MRFPPEILPIVSEDALCLVVLMVEGAPLSLEVEHKKLRITWHFVDQWGFNVGVVVGEGAVVFIDTFLVAHATELLLIFFNVVEAFDLVVSEFAVFSATSWLGAELRRVLLFCTSSDVHFSMVLIALFMIVKFRIFTVFHFKIPQVQMPIPIVVRKSTPIIYILMGNYLLLHLLWS
jgi:hypothetical protein